MEFPDLGAHCFVKTCNRLDFLPMKCDSCSRIFCKDHILYSNHSCINAYEKDNQVPVCPLCNQPVPSKRGETPDIAVGQHIDADCSSQSAVSKRKVYTNRCSLKGCKQKELIPLMCNSCRKNYCLKHRHPADHKCQEIIATGRPLSHSGAAAISRVQNTKANHQSSFKNFFHKGPTSSSVRQQSQPVSNLQAGMSEDEALARALQASMVESSHVKSEPRNLQEEEDRQLAEALAASEREAAGCPQGTTQSKDKSCNIS